MNEMKGVKTERQQGGCVSAYSYRSGLAAEKNRTPEQKNKAAAVNANAENSRVSLTLSKEGEEKAEDLYADRQEQEEKKKSVSYDATKDMAALAGASKIGQVKRLKSRIHMTAVTIQKSGADQRQVKLAVMKIKKVLKKVEQKQNVFRRKN